MHQFNLDSDDFRAIIDGMEMDVRKTIQAPPFLELDLYCDRVASAVGRLSTRVFGLPNEDGKALSEHLGRALQLTNILRDLDEDAAIGRLYLPREFLNEAGITSTDPVSRACASGAAGGLRADRLGCALAFRGSRHRHETAFASQSAHAARDGRRLTRASSGGLWSGAGRRRARA